MPNPVDPNQVIPSIRPMFRTLGIAASGLAAQRLRMETIATNIANAETTHGPNGQPYRRRVVQMEAGTAESFQRSLKSASEAGAADAPMKIGNGAGPAANDPIAAAQAAFEKKVLEADKLSGAALERAEEDRMTDNEPWGVRVSAITEDSSDGPLVYDPAHPDANANGYVRYPNVRINDELVDMMDAKRMYEANVTVFQAAKQMLRSSLNI
jgi:flagellar basal-body rod protein FlgC